jgi:hypothetical protein
VTHPTIGNNFPHETTCIFPLPFFTTTVELTDSHYLQLSLAENRSGRAYTPSLMRPDTPRPRDLPSPSFLCSASIKQQAQ